MAVPVAAPLGATKKGVVMKSKTAAGSLLSLLLILTGVLAIAPGARAEEQDPPSRVARISYLHGSVSFQANGAGEWGNAVLNRPVTIGDRLWTDAKARAELQAGDAMIHLNDSTALSFLNLDDRTVQMRMAEGEMNFRVRELREGELYEVDTPNLAFTVTRAGAFRVDVNEAGDFTGVSVFRGEGEITAGGHSYKVREGERAEFRGMDKLEYNTFPAPRADKFDRWAMERDLRSERSVSSRYVSRDVIGYEDLDDYGVWRETSGYGYVWYPRSISVGWAPYRYGHWAWIEPWGWTWVDYEPWGFAPFHYGRWAYVGGTWGWCPGPMRMRSVYAPALVAFVGGSHWGVSVGIGGGGPVGWFPLGYGEPYYPSYRSSRTYINNVNISNTRITNVNIINNNTTINNYNYAYQHDNRAVTAVPHGAFVNGESVQHASMRLRPEDLRHSEVLRGAEGISPNERSRMPLAAGRERVAMPPSAVERREVISRATPAESARHLPVRSAEPGRELSPRGADRGPESGRMNGPVGMSGRGDVRPSPREDMRVDRPSGAGNENPRSSQRSSEMERAPDRPMPERRGGQLDRPPSARTGSVGNAESRRPVDSMDRGSERSMPQRGPETRSPDRPMDRPMDRPVERSIERPVERSVERPVDRPVERSVDRPDNRSSNRPADRPVERTVERPSRTYEAPRETSRPPVSYDRGASRSSQSPRYSAPSRSSSAPRTSAPPRSSGGSGARSTPRGNSGGNSHSRESSHSNGGTARGREH